MVESVGQLLLVHVSTPLEVCESRDRKGLYAKARAGMIAEFTGISDPYETPVDADLRIDTSHTSVDDAIEQILATLSAARPDPSGGLRGSRVDLGLALAGLFVGVVVGLTGMGGGALMTPVLVLFFGVQPLAAVSSDLVASAVMKPSAASSISVAGP